MKLKKFVAVSLKEGKDLITKELGNDAVIMSTKSIPNPDVPGTTLLEIVAAITDGDSSENQEKYSKPAKLEPNEIRSVNNSHHSASDISSELNQIRNILSQISDSVKYKYSNTLGELYGELYIKLLNSGFSESLTLEITGKLSAEQKYTTLRNLIPAAKELIIKDIKFIQPLNTQGKRSVLAFIGPTGSGKTSTLIKIAILNKLLLNTNILLISADTNKVGGSDQLQTLASIAGIPFRSAYSASDLKKIVNEENERDLILIDTTGRSHKKREYLEEINDYLQPINPEHIYLVLSCTTEKELIRDIIKEFSFIKFNSLILTKFDETNNIGGLIETIRSFYYPLSYITTGQEIPDDIEPAKKDYIFDRLIN